MKSALAAIALAVVTGGIVAASTILHVNDSVLIAGDGISYTPLVYVNDWDDLSCTAGDPVIRLFPARHAIEVTCE